MYQLLQYFRRHDVILFACGTEMDDDLNMVPDNQSTNFEYSRNGSTSSAPFENISLLPFVDNSTYSYTEYNSSTQHILVEPKPLRVLKILVIFVGCIGTLANGLVVYVLSRSDQQKKSVPIFIINQLTLDLFSSISLILVYTWKLAEVRLYGTLNVVLCSIIGSEDIFWIGVAGSTVNLTFMTIERYIKIVFPKFYQDFYRNWITYFLMFLSWATGFSANFPVIWITTDFTDGNCLPLAHYPSVEYAIGVGVFGLLLSYILPITTFLICYGHIIITIRRSGQLLSSPVSCANTAQAHTDKNERSIIKIMVTVSGTFTVLWAPLYVTFLITTSECCTTNLDAVWYVSLFLGHVTLCIQPFIYVFGLKSNEIKKHVFNIFGKKYHPAVPSCSAMLEVKNMGHI